MFLLFIRYLWCHFRLSPPTNPRKERKPSKLTNEWKKYIFLCGLGRPEDQMIRRPSESGRNKQTLFRPILKLVVCETVLNYVEHMDMEKTSNVEEENKNLCPCFLCRKLNQYIYLGSLFVFSKNMEESKTYVLTSQSIAKNNEHNSLHSYAKPLLPM